MKFPILILKATALLVAFLSQIIAAEVVYDENIDGSLPFGLSNISLEEIQNAKIDLSPVSNEVVGESESGESFLVSIPSNHFLQRIRVTYNNHIDSNEHVLLVEEVFPISVSYPHVNTRRGILNTSSPMPTVGSYVFNFDIASQNAEEGLYAIYAGSSVQGVVPGNSFEIAFEVVDELVLDCLLYTSPSPRD